MRIACIGGGPGGVFFATLVRQFIPNCEVVVFERNQADDTFGFGVVFSDSTLRQLAAYDDVLTSRLSGEGTYWQNIEIRLKGAVELCGGNGMAAIPRKKLLRLLYDRATEVGVDFRFKHEVSDLSGLDEFDLIVASDGANSLVRSRFETVFEPRIDSANAKFIWFGTTYRFNGLTFLFEQSKYGTFAVHGYPIDDDIGTFIVETDEKTWHNAGLDRFNSGLVGGLSDEYSKAFFEELFGLQIQGQNLLVNHSRWGNFRTIRCKRWSAENRYVLLGDSAHTAHFSVGSGTKMAMEDASALALSLANNLEDIPSSLFEYESIRRPSVERIQGSAVPSLGWWERFGTYFKSFDPDEFALHFLTRSISLDKLAKRDQVFVDRKLDSWADKHGASPLQSPISIFDHEVVERQTLLYRADDADISLSFNTTEGCFSVTLVGLADQIENPTALFIDLDNLEESQLSLVKDANPNLVVIAGGSKMNRISLSEFFRFEKAVTTLVVQDEVDFDEAQTLILSGRADLVGTFSSSIV